MAERFERAERAGRSVRADGSTRPPRGAGPQGRVFRKKVCRFCSSPSKNLVPDYKEVEFLQKFLTEKGKIIPRRITGNCSKHQRRLAATIKRSRHSGLLAFQLE